MSLDRVVSQCECRVLVPMPGGPSGRAGKRQRQWPVPALGSRRGTGPGQPGPVPYLSGPPLPPLSWQHRRENDAARPTPTPGSLGPVWVACPRSIGRRAWRFELGRITPGRAGPHLSHNDDRLDSMGRTGTPPRHGRIGEQAIDHQPPRPHYRRGHWALLNYGPRDHPVKRIKYIQGTRVNWHLFGGNTWENETTFQEVPGGRQE
jgi:hypothetical protein